MRKMIKCAVSLLLCLVMTVGLLPVTASAATITQAQAVQWATDRADEHWEINDGTGMTQCTEFVAMYYWYLTGTYKVYGNAAYYLSDASGACLYSLGWTRPAVSSAQPGDIFIQNGEPGHVGVIIARSGNSLTVAAANSGYPRGACCKYKETLSSISGLIRPAFTVSLDSFPDKTFREYVKRFDTDGDGALSQAEIDAVNEINVENMGIKSLKGIENFTSLRYLFCTKNILTGLDVSKNTALIQLLCGDNKLTELVVSNNTELLILNCSKNKLKNLDVSRNTRLSKLICNQNEITKLSIPDDSSLAYACKGKKTIDGNTVRFENSEGYGAVQYILLIDKHTSIPGFHKGSPLITVQPKKQEALKGKKATFTVKAAGDGLSYQWYRQQKGSSSWIKLIGCKRATLTFVVKPDMDGYKYRCEIKNSSGKVTSKTAKLIVVTKPRITTEPKAASVKAGKIVTFRVKAAGGALSYQWYCQKPGTSKWEKISKATMAACSFKATKEQNGYKFRCVVTNAAGKVNSKAVKLTVK